MRAPTKTKKAVTEKTEQTSEGLLFMAALRAAPMNAAALELVKKVAQLTEAVRDFTARYDRYSIAQHVRNAGFGKHDTGAIHTAENLLHAAHGAEWVLEQIEEALSSATY